MKKINFSFIPLLVLSFTLIFSSCNSPEAPKVEDKKAEDTAVATTRTPQTTATPVFTPMKVFVSKHKVADYANWRAAYDSHDSLRKAFGLTTLAIGRGIDDPKVIWVVNKSDDIQKAKDFAMSPALKDAMKKAGVAGKPDFFFYDVIRMNQADPGTKDRVIITHKVKDFDAWLKVYDGEGKPARAAQGMIDGVLARSIDDSNIVHIVFAVTDMAKAKAAINSEEKKKLMMSAGVIGKPTIEYYKNAD